MPEPITVVKARNISKIPVYDAPPARGGHRRFLCVEEINAKLGIDFKEGLFVEDQQTLDRIKAINFQAKKGVLYRTRTQQLEERLNRPFSGLAIAKINDDVGYGVFAERDIPANTVLCIYSGLVKTLSKSEQELQGDDYLMPLDDQHSLIVAASRLRGIAGFMQHLPRNHELEAKATEALFMNDQYMAEMLNIPLALLQRARADGRITDDIIKQTLAEASPLNNAADTEWAEINFINDSNREVENTIASANVKQELIPYQAFMY